MLERGARLRSSVPVELRVVLARLLHLVVPTVHRALGAAGAREEETAVVGSILRRQPPQFGMLRLAWPSICIRVIVSSLMEISEYIFVAKVY